MDFEKYNEKNVPYPNEESYNISKISGKISSLKREIQGSNGAVTPIAEEIDRLSKLLEITKEEYSKKKEVYNEEVGKLHEQFEIDLYEDLGISNNPKKEKLFSVAWGLGHSSGFQSVYSYACELVELIE